MASQQEQPAQEAEKATTISDRVEEKVEEEDAGKVGVAPSPADRRENHLREKQLKPKKEKSGGPSIGASTTGQVMIMMPDNPRGYSLTDIGANLLDEAFARKHEGDNMYLLLERAKQVGVSSIIVTAGTISDSREAIAFVRKCRAVTSVAVTSGAAVGGGGDGDKGGTKQLWDLPNIYCTVGIHPTQCSVFKACPDEAPHGGCSSCRVCSPEAKEAIIRDLEELVRDGISDGTVIMIGECGLDYDRLHFCEKEFQKVGFAAQLEMASRFKLPLFLHDRNTGDDFTQMLRDNCAMISDIGGVVHSFTDSVEHLNDLLTLTNIYIGINGCSLKTEENLVVAKNVPLDKLLLETDAPYCSIKKSSAGYKHIETHFPTKKKFEKGLLLDGICEPCMLVQVLEVVATLKGVDPKVLASQVKANAEALFRHVRRPDDPGV